MNNWKTHRVEIRPGHTWAVKDSKTGNNGRQTLVFVHGRFSSQENWSSYAEHYRRKGYRVITYDLDGHGKSTGDGTLTLQEHADGLKKILDRLGVQRTVLVGHSDGGVIAQQFCADHPNQVKALALVNSYRKLPEETRQLIATLAELHDLEITGASLSHRIGRQLLKLKALNLLTEGRFGVREVLGLFNPFKGGTLKVLQNHSLAFNTAEAPAIAHPPPLCVLHTQQDFLVTREPIDEFKRMYGDAEIHVLDKNTHFPHTRYPEWVREKLDSFLEGLNPYE